MKNARRYRLRMTMGRWHVRREDMVMVRWERTTNCVNSGGWRVYDDRLDRLSTLYRYTKREAQRAHAEHVRSLKR